MRTLGIILGAVVGGLVLYVVYSLVAGGTANASTGGNVLNRTSGANAQTPPPGSTGGSFKKWSPSSAGAITTGITGVVEKITGAKVLGWGAATNTWADGRPRTR